MPKTDREALRIRIQRDDGKPVFLDNNLERRDSPPKHIRVPHNYAELHDWIELVGVKYINRPAGPKDQPMKNVHTLPQCKELIFHMADGDVRYKVVGQPDKYDLTTGKPTDAAGDPNTEVRWYFDADLIGS